MHAPRGGDRDARDAGALIEPGLDNPARIEATTASIPAAAERGAPAVPAVVAQPEPTSGVESSRRLDDIRARDSVYRRLLAFADVLSLLGALWLGAIVVGGASLKPAVLAMIPAIVVLAKLSNLYDRDENRMRKQTLDELPALFHLSTLVALLCFLASDWIAEPPLADTAVLAFWASLLALLVATRGLSRIAARSITPAERVLLVAPQAQVAEVARKLRFGAVHAELVGVVPPNRVGMRADDPEPLEGHHALTERIQPFLDELEPHRVILAAGSWTPDEILHTVDDLKGTGIKVSIMPPISRIASMSFEVDQLPGMALFGMPQWALNRSSRLVKAAFDKVVSGLALVVLSPLMAAIAVAIKIESPGPVFFRQPRVGRDSDDFRIFKFRSMVDGADAQKRAMEHLNESPDLFKITDDPRVTRVGRFLRRHSLDELPQLINVLRGEMSLVGPRPLVPNEDERIEGFYRSRLDISPGITGHWQVLGSWRVPFEDMVMLDYLYAANWSLWDDIKLLWNTVPYVLSRRNV